jgi:hypothetical protein
LISNALAGDPPEEVAEELRDLLEDVYFRRHLELRGISLDPAEFQMSLQGSAVGFGMARSKHFVGRVKDLETMIYRTAERRLGREFREGGRRRMALSEELVLYVSVPRVASLAVTFRVGRSDQLKLPGIDFSRNVVDDLMDCVDIVNGGSLEELKAKIPDESYFRNFLGLARKLAPDGEEIRVVGFTTKLEAGEREVALSRARNQVPVPVALAEVSDGTVREPQVLEIRGTLLEADARSHQEGQIQVVTADGQSSTRFRPKRNDE